MTEFVKVKTQSLEFGALDWCIAQIEKLNVELTPPNYGNGIALVFIVGTDPLYRPSTDWESGGALIEKYAVTLTPFAISFGGDPSYWLAQPWDQRVMPVDGPTPLVAACRAIVASVLGDTVSVPKELTV